MKAFPWYDSKWLATYVKARDWIARRHPARLADFEQRLAPLRTDPGFEVRQIPRVFDAATLQKIRDTIRGLDAAQLELHEARDFGRFIVHDHPYFLELQRDLTALVGEAAGESVEPGYNFLSLYGKTGVCDMHLDAPLAKWTLDVCIEQSSDWPIQLSQVVPWPVAGGYSGAGWQEKIKRDPGLRFSAYRLEPGSAILFSGSSQWHYRDALPRVPGQPQFCNLLFFHYIPEGTREVAQPRDWPALLKLPELAGITDAYRD